MPTSLHPRVASLVVALSACGLAALSVTSPASADCPGDPVFAGPAFVVGNLPGSVVLGDLDGDGDIDMVVSNQLDDDVSVLFNSGNGTFGGGTDYPTSDGPTSLALGDLDGDGDLDIAVTGSASNDVSVHFNQGHGVFAAPTPIPVGAGAYGIALGDLNNDGDLDIVVTHYFTNSLSVLLNDGKGQFEAPASYPAGEGALAVALGDIDRDGDLDMVVANYLGGTVSVLLNSGNGTFTPAATYDSGPRSASLALGDLDGDGSLDIAVANYLAANVTVLLNTCHGTFGSSATFAASAAPNAITLGDFDEDGDLDIAVANAISPLGAMTVLPNNGHAQFPERSSYGAGDESYAIAQADVDRDGDLDIVVTNYASHDVSVLLNLGLFAPRVTNQPVSIARCPGDAAVFTVGAFGSGPLSYQWRRAGQPIPGAIGPSFGLPRVTAADAAFYDVVVSNSCSSALSAPAALVVGGPDCCVADWNGDGVVNSTDVSDYINAWFGEQQLPGCVQ